MYEETGNSRDGEQQGHGATSSPRDNNLESNSNRRDPVNVVCPTCNSIPSTGLVKQYSGLSASGHSTNVYGDVQNQIIYCCSHCAPRHQNGVQDSDGYSEVSSVAASSAVPTRTLSRTQTLDTLPSISERIARPVSRGTATVASDGREIAATAGNNSGGKGLAVDSATVSLIGLKTVDESTRDPADWEQIHSTSAAFARLKVQDAHISEEKLRSNHEYPFVELARDWATCDISIEAHRHTNFRRLKIEENDTCEIWIPDTRIQVTSSDDTTVSARFSNCNKLRPPGYYLTTNGTPMSVATYHPEEPNVVFELGFTSADAASNFRNRLLHRKPQNEHSTNAFIQQSPHITIVHSSRNTDKEKSTPCLLIWKQERASEAIHDHELHDLVAISDKLDFDMAVTAEELKITIGHVDRLTYYPAFDQTDLPQNVKRTLDGAPAKSAVEGGHSADSKLCLSTTPAEGTRLVNYILSQTVPWKLEAIFPQIDAKMSKKRHIGSNSFTAQLTLWSEPSDRMIRILIRTSQMPEVDAQSSPKDTKWFSITLADGEDRATADSKRNVITIKKIDCENGNFISTKDLRPVEADTKSNSKDKGDNINSIALELKFSSLDEVQQFRQVVTERFLSVPDT